MYGNDLFFYQVYFVVLKFILIPFKLVYWFFYFTGGFLFQLMRYLVYRNFMFLHDFLFCFIAVFRFDGNSFDRFVFLLRSRLISPKHFWHAFNSIGVNSRSLPDNWNSIRKSVLREDNWRCTICGAENVELHVDHVIPRKWKGSHSKDNLRTLCRHCHICRHFKKF